MSQESDISWHVLGRIVRQWAGATAELAEVRPLDGGCISTTLALTLADGKQAVLKISPHRVDMSYEREAHQLALLRRAGLPVPEVYACHTGTLDEPFSYILMEFIKGAQWADARRQASVEQFDELQSHLAELLTSLHNTTGSYFCRAVPDPTQQFERWPDFYRTIFEEVVRDLEKSPLISPKSRKLIHRVEEKIDRLIACEDGPRLVHGDMWGSNLLAQYRDGHWRVAALLDPNCKFADVESELAYLELFQTITPAFMKAYQRGRRLSEQYHRVRKPIYQLHSLLNHVCLFGEAYTKPLGAALDRVAGLV
jgi:fructosamine-3-kinase